MVIDLKKRLDVCSTEECKNMIIINKGHNVGVLVDKVVGMILLEQEQIDKTLAIRAFLESSFIEGIAHPDNRLICVLSEKVFLKNPAVEN